MDLMKKIRKNQRPESKAVLIKQKACLVTEESLTQLWDNQYDEHWNSC